MFLLWNKENLNDSIKDFNKRIKKNDWNIKKLPALNDLKTSEQTLIIFDDFITDIKKFPIKSEIIIL